VNENLVETEIRRRIAAAGPMPVNEYMALCLSHPEHGYYMTRDPLGRAGDFITAPEVSQMFGELIGLWASAVWQAMGEPGRIRLVELGPGRGTLMHDALRAALVVPDFHAAAAVHLIEISPALIARQRQKLTGLGVPVAWHTSFEDVPEGPVIVIGNEFVDALPVIQMVKLDDGWHERVVDIDRAGHLTFGVAPDPVPRFDQLLPARLRTASVGAFYEWRSDRFALELGRRIARDGGAALLIDYGHTRSGLGETLQAVAAHGYADPLAAPGSVDLTAHVDFEALTHAVECMGARTHGPLTQGEFLNRLGIDVRAATLKAGVDVDAAHDIDAALVRLTGAGRNDMGELFKAIAFSHPSLRTLPGFEPPA
jgi:NADH dehydrogenase [ubiquinone] 1 alpha subcomplex assembly factor 7